MYPTIRNYLQSYSIEGIEESRAVADFVTCESIQTVASLKAELSGIVMGQPDERVVDQLIGPNRKKRYGTAKEWAKLILLLLSANKK